MGNGGKVTTRWCNRGGVRLVRTSTFSGSCSVDVAKTLHRVLPRGLALMLQRARKEKVSDAVEDVELS